MPLHSYILYQSYVIGIPHQSILDISKALSLPALSRTDTRESMANETMFMVHAENRKIIFS